MPIQSVFLLNKIEIFLQNVSSKMNATLLIFEIVCTLREQLLFVVFNVN